MVLRALERGAPAPRPGCAYTARTGLDLAGFHDVEEPVAESSTRRASNVPISACACSNEPWPRGCPVVGVPARTIPKLNMSPRTCRPSATSRMCPLPAVVVHEGPACRP